MRTLRGFLALATAAGVALSCASGGEDPTALSDTGDAGEVPAVFGHFASTVEISRDGDQVVLRSDGIPDHKSPYFGTSDSRWTAYDGDNPDFHLNPNRIQEQQFTFRVPVHPVVSANHEATPLGAIGVAVNGVAIFNQYAGPNRPLTYEVDSFDQYNGHPQQTGVYHYHVEPLYLTLTHGENSLVGFLLDGFPVYGPEENGEPITNADLDSYHGHFGVTEDYPDGIYHYHITAEDPYINGNGFYGVAGTVSG